MFNLAVAFARGDGGAKDLVRARAWYRRSAELGFGVAVERYGQMLGNGEGGGKDIVLSLALLQIAAEANTERAPQWLAQANAVAAAQLHAAAIAEAKRDWLKKYPAPPKVLQRIPLP